MKNRQRSSGVGTARLKLRDSGDKDVRDSRVNDLRDSRVNDVRDSRVKDVRTWRRGADKAGRDEVVR